jgi:hypothetical protein
MNFTSIFLYFILVIYAFVYYSNYVNDSNTQAVSILCTENFLTDPECVFSPRHFNDYNPPPRNLKKLYSTKTGT